jgi:hypothetical protein
MWNGREVNSSLSQKITYYIPARLIRGVFTALVLRSVIINSVDFHENTNAF